MRFLVSVPDHLHAALKSESRKRGQTLTGLVREILWDWLWRERKNSECD